MGERYASLSVFGYLLRSYCVVDLQLRISHFGFDQGAETGVLRRSYFVVAALNEDFGNAEEGQKDDFKADC